MEGYEIIQKFYSTRITTKKDKYRKHTFTNKIQFYEQKQKTFL